MARRKSVIDGEAHHRILPLLVADGGGRAAVVVAGKHHGVVGERAEPLGQRGVHLPGSLPGRSVRPQERMNSVSPEIRRPSTRKHCEPGVCPGVWMKVHGHPPHVDRVAAVDLDEVGAEAPEEFALGLVHVDLAGDRPSSSSTPGMSYPKRCPPTWS